MSVLAFIILGSIIRQINLLVLLSGLMIAPFFFNWRISMKMIERLRARRRFSDWVHAASPFTVRWQLDNDRQRIPAWGIRVNDHIRAQDADSSLVERISVLAPPIAGQSGVEVNYRCFVPTRGIYEFGPADVSSAFPVGLMRSRTVDPVIQELVVAPRCGKLTRSWSRLVTTVLEGETEKLRKRSDHDGEFYAIRPWKSGDNPRQVHWRSSARHGELMVRQLEQRTDHRLALILDFHDDQATGQDNEFALSFFTSTIDRAARGRTRPAIGIFGDQNLVFERLERPLMKDVMATLATIQPSSDNGCLEGMKQLVASSTRWRIIVLSTRSFEQALRTSAGFADVDCQWIDVNSKVAKSYFQLAPDRTGDFIRNSTGNREVGVS